MRGLRQNALQGWISEERANFVLHRRDAVGTVLKGVQGKLVDPELADRLVSERRRDLLAEAFIGKQAKDVSERTPRPLEESIERVPENVLHAHAPGVVPELPHRVEDARDRKRHLVFPDVPERVISVGRGGIRDVPVHDVCAAGPCRIGRKLLCGIAMGIDKAEAAGSVQVGKSDACEECRLSRPGLADDVCME